MSRARNGGLAEAGTHCMQRTAEQPQHQVIARLCGQTDGDEQSARVESAIVGAAMPLQPSLKTGRLHGARSKSEHDDV